jgi:peptide subunit release factor 1 (eRF1)
MNPPSEIRMTDKVSLYIAAGSNLQAVRGLVKREQVSSGNVKDHGTRERVQAALRNILA